MSKKLTDIERDAMELSPRDRAMLVERLLAALDRGEDMDAEELWLREAEKRYQNYRAEKIKAKPAEQLFEEAREKI